MKWQPIATVSKDDGFAADLWCVHPQHGGMRSPDMRWDRIRHRWRDHMGMPLNPGWVPTHWMTPPAPPSKEPS